MVRCYSRFGCKVGYAIAGIIIGISAGIAFGMVLKNVDACVFGFFSGAVAALSLMVHILWARKTWTPDEYISLVRLMYLGCFIQLIGVVSFVVYIVLGSLSQTDHLVVYGRSHFLTSVWCFMTWKWGFILFRNCRIYRILLTKNNDDVPILE